MSSQDGLQLFPHWSFGENKDSNKKRTAGCSLLERNINVLFSAELPEMKSIHFSLKEKSSIGDPFLKNNQVTT